MTEIPDLPPPHHMHLHGTWPWIRDGRDAQCDPSFVDRHDSAAHLQNPPDLAQKVPEDVFGATLICFCLWGWQTEWRRRAGRVGEEFVALGDDAAGPVRL